MNFLDQLFDLMSDSSALKHEREVLSRFWCICVPDNHLDHLLSRTACLPHAIPGCTQFVHVCGNHSPTWSSGQVLGERAIFDGQVLQPGEKHGSVGLGNSIWDFVFGVGVLEAELAW